MKKIFTLIAMLTAFAGGVNAQIISFTESDIASAGALDGKEFSNGEFKLTITDTDSKVAIDANNAYFGTSAADAVKYTHRIKSGGKSSSKNSITLTVPSSGTIKIYARTGSTSATDRNIVLTQGTEVLNQLLLESAAVSVDMGNKDTNGNPKEDNVFPIYTSGAVSAGEVALTYPVGSINFYAFEFVPGEGGGSSTGGGSETGTVLIDYPTAKDGTTISGTTTEGTVKIHTNKDAVACYTLKNGYTTSSVVNDNKITLTTDGGFKTGDVVSIAGFFNNSDDTKQAAATIFVGENGETPTNLFTTQLMINGRTNAADPTVETYTLTADYGKLYVGRADGLTGATATNISLLKVTRSTTTGIQEVLPVKATTADGAVYNLAGQRVSKDTKGILIQNGRKFINK